jgi:hypothetical protein
MTTAQQTAEATHKPDTQEPSSIVNQRQKNEAARRLLKTWLEDTSGYDEATWSDVQRIIEENRLSLRNASSD